MAKYNICFVGSVKTGKTRLAAVAKGNYGPISPNTTNYRPTIGIDAHEFNKHIPIDAAGGQPKANHHFCIWDTAGQERYQSISMAYSKGSHAIVFMTNEDDFDTDGQLKQEVRLRLTQHIKSCKQAAVMFIFPTQDLHRSHAQAVRDALQYATFHMDVLEQPSPENPDKYRQEAERILGQTAKLAMETAKKHNAATHRSFQHMTERDAFSIIDDFTDNSGGYPLSEQQRKYLLQKLTEDNRNAWTRPEQKIAKQKALRQALQSGNIVDLYKAANIHTGYGFLTSTGANDDLFPVDGLYAGLNSSEDTIRRAIGKIRAILSKIRVETQLPDLGDEQQQYLTQKLLPVAELLEQGVDLPLAEDSDSPMRKKGLFLAAALNNFVSDSSTDSNIKSKLEHFNRALSYHTSNFHWPSTTGEAVFKDWFKKAEASVATADSQGANRNSRSRHE